MSSQNKLVAIDFESFYDSATEYSLADMSAFSYIHDDRFDAYLVSVHDGESIHYVGPPAAFDWTLLNGLTPCAHNASFDQQVYERLVELGIIEAPATFGSAWICTADMTAYLGCKRDLKTAAKYLLGRDISKKVRKAADGVPGKDLLANTAMLEYSGDDAVNCYDLAATYLEQWPESEREISRLNRQTAMNGFTLNLDLVEQAIATLEPMIEAEEARIPWVWETDPLTGGRIQKPDGTWARTKVKPLSPTALKKYGNDLGLAVPASVAKDNPEFLTWLEVNKDLVPWIDALGKYRSINTLYKRVCALRDGFNPATGRFPYEKKYFGALTGRFSGGGDSGGKFNMENMPRKAMYGVDVRPMFVAPPGHVLIIADYNQIEPRYLLWRVGDFEALKPCFEGKNMYQAYAERHGVCRPDQKLKNMGGLYNMTKARVILLGYQSGPAKFKTSAEVYKVFLTDEEAQQAVFEFRRDNPRIVEYWAAHQDALAYSVRRKDDTHQVELPSGRILTYWKPELRWNVKQRRNEIAVLPARGEAYSYIYGGKLTENEDQAACRDVLCDAWRAIDRNKDMPIVNLTVHDEIVVTARIDEAKDIVKELDHIMTTSSPWAEGLPLSVDVTITPVYTKD